MIPNARFSRFEFCERRADRENAMGQVMPYAPQARSTCSTTAPPVLLHDEPPFTQEPQGVAPRFRPTLLGDLLAADDAQQRRRVVQGMLHAMGFDWLGYGRFLQRGDRTLPLSFCISYANPRWAERYFCEGYHTVDPRLHDALHSNLPCVWSIDDLMDRAPAGAPRARLLRFIADMHDSGARSGVLYRLPGEPGQERHLVSLLSRTPGTRWIGDGLLGQVLTLALSLHEFYSRYTRAPNAAPLGVSVGLTRTQQEIVRCVARGMADKEISARLQMSLHNVDYHLRRLRHRFGVRNRMQLVQAALTAQAA
jgi:DNA-binding CsgD family transcriptional regulator